MLSSELTGASDFFGIGESTIVALGAGTPRGPPRQGLAVGGARQARRPPCLSLVRLHWAR